MHALHARVRTGPCGAYFLWRTRPRYFEHISYYRPVAGMRPALLGTHEALAVEVMDSILSVSGAFKLDESKAGHNPTIDDTTVTIEEFLDILRPSVRRESCIFVSQVPFTQRGRSYCRGRDVEPFSEVDGRGDDGGRKRWGRRVFGACRVEKTATWSVHGTRIDPL